MKGGSDMKKVVLRFIGTGVGNKCQAYTRVYDKCGKIIFEGKTYDGYLTLYLEKNAVYRLFALSYGDAVINVFYVNNSDEKYIFYFRRSLRKYDNPYPKPITFLLSDVNYYNLPIEKGEMVLWQK